MPRSRRRGRCTTTADRSRQRHPAQKRSDARRGRAAAPPTDIHAGAPGTRFEKLSEHDVGGETLADAAGIEAGAGWQANLVTIDDDVRATGEQRAEAARRDGADVE